LLTKAKRSRSLDAPVRRGNIGHKPETEVKWANAKENKKQPSNGQREILSTDRIASIQLGAPGSSLI